MVSHGERPRDRRHQPFFGLTVASCEHGMIRQSPDGLYLYQWPVMPRPEGRGYKGRLRVDKGICDMIAGHYAQADRTCGLRFEVPLGVGAQVSQIPAGGSYREAVARDLS